MAAIVWIGTGMIRAFGGLENATAYYLHSHVFYSKMALFVAVVLLEIWPMVTLVRWRRAVRLGSSVDLSPAPRMAGIGRIQAGLVVLIVFAATALARGMFIELSVARRPSPFRPEWPLAIHSSVKTRAGSTLVARRAGQ